MLSDTPLNPAYNRKYNKRELQYSTARALSLGNDITAFGHSVQFVEDIVRPAQDSISAGTLTQAIYPAHAALSSLYDKYSAKTQLKAHLSDPDTRENFWRCYRILRQHRQSRKQILDVVYEAINNCN